MRTWETLLRRQHVATPLAHPDIFVHDMGTTLERVLRRWARLRAAAVPPVAPNGAWPPGCHCGRNPFLPYYLTGEEAMVATLVAVQSLRPVDADVAAAEVNALRHVVRDVGRADIDGFGAFCQTCPEADPAATGACPRARLAVQRVPGAARACRRSCV